MKGATSLMPSSNVLSGIQFSILNVWESLISNDKKKYNNSEMKAGDFLRPPHACCCEYKNDLP